jgi:hypothetical protein
VVDDGDRQVPKQLADIGLRIEGAIEEWGHDHQAHDAAIAQYAPDLADDGSAEGAGHGDERRRRFLAGNGRPQIAGKPRQPPPGEAAIEDRQGGQDGKGQGGTADGSAARRLVEEDLHIPA